MKDHQKAQGGRHGQDADRLKKNLEAVKDSLSRFEKSASDAAQVKATQEREKQSEQELDEESVGGAYPFDLLRKRYAKSAVALVRPYPPHRRSVGRCHIGGRPDLPDDVAWPSTSTGHPLHFLAQVDFADFPKLAGEAFDLLPVTGTLLFFVLMEPVLDLEQADRLRVIFDPGSSGVPASPPADLSPVDEHWRRHFAHDGEEVPNLYPSWPLEPVAIQSLPDLAAFHVNAPFNPRFDDYARGLSDFRVEELRKSADLSPANGDHWPDLGVFAPSARDEPTRLRGWEETGFPWTARGIALVARSVLRRSNEIHLVSFAADLDRARVHAEARQSSERVGAEEARAFVDLINAVLQADMKSLVDREGVQRRYCRGRVRTAINVALHRLVTEAGGDPALARAIPDALYDPAYPCHAPITRREQGGQEVRHAQMLGYMGSSQEPLRLDSPLLTLLQIPSDPGLDLVIGDMGEFDFHIRPEHLANRQWHRTSVRYFGG